MRRLGQDMAIPYLDLETVIAPSAIPILSMSAIV